MGSDPGNGWGLARGDRTGAARPRVGKIKSRPAGGGGGKPPKKDGCLGALVLGFASVGSIAAAVWVLIDKAVS